MPSRSAAGPLARFGLGTAQFGMPYGISNTRGQVHPNEAAAIVRLAADFGVRWLDTAAAYGNAEAVLGAALAADANFEIVTKTLPLGPGGIDGVIARVRESSRLLRRRPLNALLVHSARDLHGNAGAALWDALQALKRAGEARQIGISAYFEDDPVGLAQHFAPDLMQLPISLLDQRPIKSGILSRIKDLGVTIHARSLFSQGLLFLDAENLPVRLSHGAGLLRDIRQEIARQGLSPLQAALGFALAQPAVDIAVIGVTTVQELHDIFAAAQTASNVQLDWSALALDDPILLDPRCW